MRVTCTRVILWDIHDPVQNNLIRLYFVKETYWLHVSDPRLSGLLLTGLIGDYDYGYFLNENKYTDMLGKIAILSVDNFL